VKQLCVLYMLFLSVISCAQELRIQKAMAGDVIHSYYKQLLIMALEKNANGRVVPILKEIPVYEQGRATSQIIEGQQLDIFWVGTDTQREIELRAIRIPLDRGLLGFRRFIIHKSMRAKFDQVNSIDDLKGLIGCQGLNWPDTLILRNSGLRIKEVAGFESLFQLVVAKRCDYFPRGIAEADIEISERSEKYPELMVYESLIVHYPFTIYFFVNKKNEELAQWIEQGLEKLIDSGEFYTYMQSHPFTASTIPLPTEQSVQYFRIPNPLLSSDTPINNSKYWFSIPN
jgi:ABC-type amino acid transport substrate-binding protein